MSTRRIGRGAGAQFLAAALVIAGLVSTGSTPAAALNTIVVTTTADVVAADGLVSLREAVTTANSDGDDTVVTLATDATYTLSICAAKSVTAVGTFFWGPPADDDVNLDGDLDHTAPHDLTIEGNGSTLVVDCDFDRAFDSFSPDATLTIDDLTIDGIVGPPDSGIAIYSRGDLHLDNITINETIGTWNQGGDVRPLLTGQASVEAGTEEFGPGPTITVADSTFLLNTRGAISVDNADLDVIDSQFFDTDGPAIRGSFSGVHVSGSTLVDGGSGVSGIDSNIEIVDTVAANNTGFGFRNTGNSSSGQDLVIQDSQALFNGSGGARCSYCTGLHVTGSSFTDNFGPGLGMVTNVVGPTMTVSDSAIADNQSDATAGGGISMEGDFFDPTDPRPTVTISTSTIEGNSSAGDGGGIWSSDAALEITNSTITGNTSQSTGGGIHIGGGQPLGLSQVTLVENTATVDGDNLDQGTSPLLIGSTVIARAGANDNCIGSGSVTSLGHNQVDDTTCGVGAGTGDVAPAADPMLDVLADNGGPTLTHLPLAGSPLIDQAGACSGVDQRGVVRPQGGACDVGAVEVAPPVPMCDGVPATIVGSGVINGTAGPDVIVGSALDDTITGFGGDDVICGLDGSDLLVDYAGDDRLFGGPGNDRLLSGNGSDVLDGGPDDDVLKGGNDDDVLIGGDGDDDLVGGNDDDIMVGGEGDDRFRGGPGTDTADYSSSPGPVTVYINDTPDDGTALEADDVQLSVEIVIGSAFADVLIGTVVNDRLIGGPGFDRLVGRAGNDVLIGGPGGDLLLGGADNDILVGANGIDRCLGAAGVDTYTDCESDDTTPPDPGPPSGHPARCIGLVPTITGAGVINGTGGPDVILGSPGPDTITGFGGDDIICGGGGNDVIIDYSGDDQLFGGDGNDRMFGGVGNDLLDGGPGHDVLKGQDDDDTLRGDYGDDDLVGGPGDDDLRGGEGDDRFRGGPGFDTVDYTASNGYVLAFRGSGADDGPFHEADDIQESVEAIQGSLYSDTLIGSNSPDTIRGATGNDRIIGRAGNDVLIGGPDDDFLLGGAGNDILDGANDTDRCIGLGGNDTTNNCEINQP